MTLLQKRKLRLIAKRIIRNDKKRKIYLLNLHWLKIKKQKLRRRRKTFIKLWKLKRLNTLRKTQWVA
jgi:pyruvate-formate lyase-activating enzyme